MRNARFKEDHYQRLKPLLHYWRTLQQTSSLVSIGIEDLAVLNKVHQEVYEQSLNISCSTCIGEAIRYMFIQYEKYENHTTAERELEISRKRRPRIQNSPRG